MSFRTYTEVGGSDRSELLEQVISQRQRVRDRLRTIGRVVAVMSGKGGVGKSAVAATLAVIAARRHSVGLLDADLKGPTAAQMLGAQPPLVATEHGIEPASGYAGVKVFSTDLLLEEGRPLAWNEPASEKFIWRSALETGALREFLSDVVWGELDLLLVDLPPGSERVCDLAELVPDLAGAIVVTIPSNESRRSVERAMRAAKDAGVRMIGIVENMSGYACAGCLTTQPLFEGDAGALLAAEFAVPLLCSVPFIPGMTVFPPGPLIEERLAGTIAAILE
ncbi:MAG: P-loop NTPase [Gemmatimonadaceae bacterium]